MLWAAAIVRETWKTPCLLSRSTCRSAIRLQSSMLGSQALRLAKSLRAPWLRHKLMARSSGGKCAVSGIDDSWHENHRRTSHEGLGHMKLWPLPVGDTSPEPESFPS